MIVRARGVEEDRGQVILVQSLSCVQCFMTSWTTACQTPLSSINSLSLLKFRSIESVMLSNHLILCCPLLLPSIFAFPPPVDHILSELFTMTHLSWVALHLMAHSFNELCKLLRPTKAVIHEGASYIYYSTNQSQPH